jgi:cyclophilin family peptidyl-prolyl cis-trans isomerase
MLRKSRSMSLCRSRRTSFEELESRQLLSITMPTIADQTVMAGAPLNVALNGSGTNNPVSYTVSVSGSTFSSGQFSAIIPQGNTSVRMHVDYTGDSSTETDDIHGDMVFQLADDLAPEAVDQILALINNTSIRGVPFYNGLTFHRVSQGFMVQGGDPAGNGTGGPGFKFDDQFNTDLQFTGSGVLALANSGSDTNGSQFFITTAAYRYGDFRYTIIGNMIEGGDILNKLQNVPVHDNGKGENSAPNYAVTISTVTTFTDTKNGLLRLSALNGLAGSANVTVTATDTVTHDTASKTFHVTVSADTYNDPPYLGNITPIDTYANTPVAFDLSSVDVENTAVYYDYDHTSLNSNITVALNNATGHGTLTPSNGLAGVYSIYVGVKVDSSVLQQNTSYDSQYVPIYIHPAAPTSITLLSASDTGSSHSDGVTTVNHALQFQVNGVLDGAEVKLYANGQLIGTGTASGTSVIITTDSNITLNDGNTAITAVQTLKNQAVNVGNLHTTVNLASNASAAATITIDTAPPQYNFTPGTKAGVGLLYSCHVTTIPNTNSSIAYQLVSGPNGMTIDANSGLVKWTPTSGEGTSANVTIRATDLAGNTTDKSYSIDIVPLSELPPEITVLNGTTILFSGDATALNLGSVLHNATTPSITLTIRNDGGQTLTLPSTFASTTHFTVSSPAKTSLASGESTTFTITLKTNTVWSGSEQISFDTNDSTNDGVTEDPFTILVSGSVTAPPPEITVLKGSTPVQSGGTIDLGEAMHNTAGSTITLTIRNDGEQNLNLTAPFTGSTHFVICQPGKTTLGAGETTTFTIKLSTGQVWTGTEQISFGNNDSNESPFILKLKGNVTVSNHDFSTIGLFNPYDSIFYLKNTNSAGAADIRFNYGSADSGVIDGNGNWTGCICIAGDWNGDGVDTIGLYDPKTSIFYLRDSNSAGYANHTFQYGPAGSGWMPVVGDWNVDGIDTIGLYNPATSTFYLKNMNTAGAADVKFVYGSAGSGLTPIVGDWNADGVETVGLYNSATSTFYLRDSNTVGAANVKFTYGPAGSDWMPIVGDWNVNGIDTIGLYDPIHSTFYLRDTNTAGYADAKFNYGPFDPGWLPMVGNWTGVQGLTAANGVAANSTNATKLTTADLQPIIAEAIDRWENAGLDPLLIAKLKQVQFTITDLPGALLGEANADSIHLDGDAAGHGWFVDSTPSLNEEFADTGDSRLEAIDPRAVDRIDLLSVVEHELGHVAGFDDLDASNGDVMSAALGGGVRCNL